MCKGNKSVEQEQLMVGKEETKILGEETEYKTFLTALLDSNPRVRSLVYPTGKGKRFSHYGKKSCRFLKIVKTELELSACLARKRP